MTFCAEQFDILFCCFRSFYSMKHGTLYIIRDTNIQRWRKGYLFHRNVRKPISQIGCCLAILLVTLPQINWIEITSLVLRFHYFSREKKSSMYLWTHSFGEKYEICSILSFSSLLSLPLFIILIFNRKYVCLWKTIKDHIWCGKICVSMHSYEQIKNEMIFSFDFRLYNSEKKNVCSYHIILFFICKYIYSVFESTPVQLKNKNNSTMKRRFA